MKAWALWKWVRTIALLVCQDNVRDLFSLSLSLSLSRKTTLKRKFARRGPAHVSSHVWMNKTLGRTLVFGCVAQRQCGETVAHRKGKSDRQERLQCLLVIFGVGYDLSFELHNLIRSPWTDADSFPRYLGDQYPVCGGRGATTNTPSNPQKEYRGLRRSTNVGSYASHPLSELRLTAPDKGVVRKHKPARCLCAGMKSISISSEASCRPY